MKNLDRDSSRWKAMTLDQRLAEIIRVDHANQAAENPDFKPPPGMEQPQPAKDKAAAQRQRGKEPRPPPQPSEKRPIVSLSTILDMDHGLSAIRCWLALCELSRAKGKSFLKLSREQIGVRARLKGTAITHGVATLVEAGWIRRRVTTHKTKKGGFIRCIRIKLLNHKLTPWRKYQ